ncbi:GATA zinc finger domain-containing protein 14-like [Bombina bombina]|uniref:GATA zinc finger domain-containing protein 14-like n=1 Tax=Bombina bombina TaxID=8345 RepID=UPI00235B2E5D|nr:GATA zinc finger domain-containing protein 14-like [Bombina bombina]
MDIFGTRDSILDDIHNKIDPSDSTYNKYRNDTINEDTLSELENVLFKEIKQKLELAFLKKYIKEQMVPRGLRLKKDCTFELNEEHQKEWYDILETASSKLVNVIIKSREATTQDLGIKIQNCKEILDKITLSDTLNTKQQEIAKRLGDLNKEILEVKWRKFNRDLNDYKGTENQDSEAKPENHKHLFSSRKPTNDIEHINNTTHQTPQNDHRERITNRDTMHNRNLNERQYANNYDKHYNNYSRNNRNNRNNFNRQHSTDGHYQDYREHRSQNYEYRNDYEHRNQGYWGYNHNHNRHQDTTNREQRRISTHQNYRHYHDNQRDYLHYSNEHYRNEHYRGEREQNRDSHNHNQRHFENYRNMNTRHNEGNTHTNWRNQYTEETDWETPTNHHRKINSPRHKESHNNERHNTHQTDRNIESANRYSALTHENEDNRTPTFSIKAHSSRLSF